MVNNNALILSGGGARAAYQVGVLSAMGKILPKGSSLPFSILCGTSAGALNATMLATHADNFTKAISTLAFVWRHLTPDQIYTVSRWPVARSVTKTLLSLFHRQNSSNPIALMNNDPLKELLTNHLDFSAIATAIDQGQLSALAITAMSYSTGESTTFFQGSADKEAWKGKRRRGKETMLNVDHLLASSAIPTIFPAHKVQEHYYGDGAIRQKSAIQPALQLGAKKLFIIGVSGNRSAKNWAKAEEQVEYNAPSIGQILGQLLNSAFIDNLEDDISHLELLNSLVHDLPEEKRTKYDLPTNTLIISPSEEINEIANHYIYTLPKNIRVLLKAVGGSSPERISSAASYLLFTPEYCRALIDLGRQDAMWEKDRIMAFFEDQGENKQS
ncbi:patatin-like phospholipase family protein [Marinomonas transparens]|uniref:Patatin-like phospholipase family protein n=1 Tax=Marinomonas transparens TaxID=2795388 RepID=A0A934JW91_9GAMM|nr:patatin-like phospholipase family protein [Marinomonas transparens]MBJ7538152.1 patatin-like phospholipase family protein [Marinomonas transparens]